MIKLDRPSQQLLIASVIPKDLLINQI